MFTGLPDTVDVWRMVAQGRCFEGSLPLASMTRLADSLVNVEGAVRFTIEFGRDDFGVAFITLHVEGQLPLLCQRNLEPFDWTFSITTRLGLIRREEDETGLPAGYEALLVQNDEVRLADVVEDELILALPLVPIRPGSEVDKELVWPSEKPSSEKPHPFAALSAIKKH